MSFQHAELAGGRWRELSFIEQMANIGSEVERALRRRAQNSEDSCRLAFERALELIDLTLADGKNKDRLTELARVREALVDFFAGANEYMSSAGLWKNYFDAFAYAARRNT